MDSKVSVKEARKLLGKPAASMTDEEIENTIITLTAIAHEALQQAKRRRQMKNDAMALAELTYDIYQEEKLKQESDG